jgi:hypothetical protein
MYLVHADTLRGQVVGGGGGGALEIESFLGPVKWRRADWRVPFGARTTRTLRYVNNLLDGLKLNQYFLNMRLRFLNSFGVLIAKKIN